MNEPITSEDLMLLACGELDDERAAVVRDHATLQQELGGIERALMAVRYEYATEVEPGFSAKVRKEVSQRSIWRRMVLGPVGAIAAAILLVSLLWSMPTDRNSSGL